MKRVTTLALAVLILLGAFRCAKESADVIPADITATGGVTPGDDAPRVSLVIPDGSASPYPTNTQFVIVFSMAVNPADLVPPNFTINSSSAGVLIPGVDYTIDTSLNPIVTITFDYGGAGLLLPADTVTVNIGAGVRDNDDGDPLQNPGPYSFTTGVAPDTTAPVRIPGSHNPVLPNVSLTAPDIRINLSEPTASGIIPSSVKGTTFWLETFPGLVRVPVTYPLPVWVAVDTWQIAMTPTVSLSPGTTYRVRLTTGVEDLAGNNLAAAFNWNFTTTSDPVGGAVTFTEDLAVDGVTATTAEVHWGTSETTNYSRIRYGRGDTVPIPYPGDLTYLSFHAVTMNPPFLAGKRYWLQFWANDIADPAGNLNAAPSPAAPLQLNTETAEVPVTVHAGAQRQSVINLVQQKAGVANTGIFAFWQESDIPATRTHLYGQLYDSAAAAQWNAGSPNALYTTLLTIFTYGSAVEDELGGVIVLASDAGNFIYAKRLNAAGGFVNWGATADQATDLGFYIATGLYPSAVPVYANILQHVDGGTETRGSEALPNRVYEHDLFGLNTLFDLVADGDVIVDTANHTGTTIDVNSVAPDFGYIVGQDGFQAVAPGEAYVVGDVNFTLSDNAADHGWHLGSTYNSGGTFVYTAHGFVPPAWLGVNDIITDGAGSYGQLTAAPAAITVPAAIDSGTASADRLNHLIDGSASWTSLPGLDAGDGVKNTTAAPDTYSTVFAIIADTDLQLNDDLFPAGTENFEIYDRISTGTASDVSVNFRLTDTANPDNWTALVAVGDIVWNLTTGLEATVTLVVDDDNLDLSADIFNFVTDSYIILAAATLDSGTANADLLNHLIDGGAAWGALVSFGDLVRNTGAGTYATVTAVTDTDLTLSADIFPAGAGNYEIYADYCTTHPLAPIDTFYRLTVDWAIGITSPTPYTLYDYDATIGVATADTPPANPLYDDGANFTGIPLLPGDIVINFTNLAGFLQIATVNTGVYAVHPHAADLSADVLVDNDDFEIVRFDIANAGMTDVVRWGTATGGTPTTLVHVGTNFTVAPAAAVGDIVYVFNNLGDEEYAMVTGVAANTLTLSRDALSSAGDKYIVIRKRGALYVWQTGGQVHAKVLSIDDPSVELVGEWIIPNSSTSPRTLADGEGNAIVLYVDTNGEIQAEKYDAAGNNIWGGPTEIDTQFAFPEIIIKILSDESGGVVVLYKYNNNLYVQRVTGAGNPQWGPNGLTIENGVLVTTDEDFVYVAANDDVIAVVAVNAPTYDVWARRVSFDANFSWAGQYISWPTVPAANSRQRYPQIYYNSLAGTAIIAWEDDRFISSAGAGIFGMKLNATTGAMLPAWRANLFGAIDDYNGVSIILNRYNTYDLSLPLGNAHMRLMPYNNSNEALIFWEDNRLWPANSSDVLAFDLNMFAP